MRGDDGREVGGIVRLAQGAAAAAMRNDGSRRAPGQDTLVFSGGSSSVGSMTTQLATAAGIRIVSPRLWTTLSRTSAPLDKSLLVVFDAVSSHGTYGNGLRTLEAFGGGRLACVHPPPAEVPDNVAAGMIFAVNEVATPVWRNYVTEALQQGKLKCLPAPILVGKGLDRINEALAKCEAGVGAGKLVVEL